MGSLDDRRDEIEARRAQREADRPIANHLLHSYDAAMGELFEKWVEELRERGVDVDYATGRARAIAIVAYGYDLGDEFEEWLNEGDPVLPDPVTEEVRAGE